MLFLCSCSCSKVLYWPAYIDSFDGFTQEEESKILDSIQDINKEAKEELFLFAKKDGHYPISFSKEKSNIIKFQKQTISGITYTRESKCEIVIYPITFENKIVKIVIWHELGHCGKLDHVKKEKEIMSTVSDYFENYSQASIDIFLQNLKESIKYLKD